jgi:hypothetical protein
MIMDKKSENKKRKFILEEEEKRLYDGGKNGVDRIEI